MGTQQSTIIMKLIDGVTGPAGSASNAMRNLLDIGGKAGASGGLMSGLLDTTVGQLATVVSAYKIAQFAKEGFLEAAQEETQFMRMRQRTGATIAEVNRARDAIDEMTMHFGVAHNDMIEGFQKLAVGGRSFADSLALLPQAATAAQAFGVAIKDAAVVADALDAQLKISAADMPKAFDLMAGAARAGNVSVSELMTILPELGAKANAAGMKGTDGLRQLLAILETVRPNFASSAEAAGALGTVLDNLQKKTVLAAFAKQGIDLKARLDAAKKSGDNLVEVFYNAAIQMTKGDLSKLPSFFARGAADLVPFLKALQDSGGAWQAFDEAARHSGETVRDANEAMNSTEAQLKRLAEAWRKAKEETGKALIDAGAVEGLKWVTDEIRRTVNDFKQLADDIHMIGVRTGIVTATKEDTARLLAEKVKTLEDRLAEYRTGKQTPVKEQLAINAEAELARLRGEQTKAIAEAQAAEAAAAPAKPPVSPTAVGGVVKPMYDLTKAGITTPLEAVVTPKVERGADLTAPLSAMGVEAGQAAGVAAGNSMINSMLDSVRKGIGEVKAAIESGLAGTTANVNVKLGGVNASMRDAPTPANTQ